MISLAIKGKREKAVLQSCVLTRDLTRSWLAWPNVGQHHRATTTLALLTPSTTDLLQVWPDQRSNIIIEGSVTTHIAYMPYTVRHLALYLPTVLQSPVGSSIASPGTSPTCPHLTTVLATRLFSPTQVLLLVTYIVVLTKNVSTNSYWPCIRWNEALNNIAG